MDPAYDALDAAASSYTKSRDHDGSEGRHRSHRDRDRDHDRHGGDRRHRERDDRDDRYRDRGDREHNGHRDDRRGDYRDRERGGYERDYDDRGPPRRRRREDDDVGRAEPMGGGGMGHRDRRPRYDEEPFAQPMRGYDAPPPRGGGGRDDFRTGQRGGGGRDGGRGRDEGRRGGGGGGRNNSPPRSPTPPGTRPLEERHLEQSLWDIRPASLQGVGAMEAKMTGMFTYGPGRVPPPAHLGIPPSLIAGSFPPGDLVNPMRQSKRLYIGGVNDTMTEDGIKEHFNKLYKEKGLGSEAEPIINCHLDAEKGYAYIEFTTADQATAGMALDETTWEDGTTMLRVKRPKDYIGIDPSLGMVGAATTVDSPNKLFVGGLPTYLNEEQVLELLKSFGELKSFNLVKDGKESKGFAFAEYQDTETTDMAIAGLHNFNLGDRTLVVQRAAVGQNSGVPNTYSGGFYAQSVLANANSTDTVSSRVVLLLNMVQAEDLYDDQEYQDILEDVNEECGKYGEIEGVRVPRPVPKNTKWEAYDSAFQTEEKNRKEDEKNGVGRVYVMYKAMDSAEKAIKNLAGRQFAGRTILVACVPEAEFLGPAPPPPPPAIEWNPSESTDGAANGNGQPESAIPEPPKEPEHPVQDINAAVDDALKDILG